jgi:Uma2 family endonuclease
MSTTATRPPVTPDDLLRMPDSGKGFELVNGELKELSVSRKSSHVAGEIYLRVKLHSNANQPGWVFPEGTSYRCFSDDPDRVRRPDTSYIALSRMTAEQYDEDGHCPIVPDLAVEVISPTDNAEQVEDKIGEWLAAGVKVLWEVYPNTRVVRAHRPDGTITLFRAADTLTAPDVLPGFAVPVADLFRLPGEPAPATAPV